MNTPKLIAVVAATAIAASILTLTAAALVGSDPSVGAAPAQDAPAGDAATSALGGGISESKYVPITPCRIVDTRLAGGKLVPAAGSRFFFVRGTIGFTTQGGNPGGCGIPESATAIEATFTAVDAGSGFLRVGPSDEGVPNATFMNYDDSFNVSTVGTITLCKTTPCDTDLRARVYGNPTHLVIDVQGYYDAPIAAFVDGDGSLARGSRVVSVDKHDTIPGVYYVTFDRDITTCTWQATTASIAPSATAFLEGGGDLTVLTLDENGDEEDSPFNVEVTC